MAIVGCLRGNESVEEAVVELRKWDFDEEDFFFPELRGYFRTVFRSRRESITNEN
jgi:hypothetical protein